MPECINCSDPYLSDEEVLRAIFCNLSESSSKEWNLTPSVVTGAFVIPAGTVGFTIINLTKVADWTFNGGTISSFLDTLSSSGLNVSHLTEAINCDAGLNSLQLILQTNV